MASLDGNRKRPYRYEVLYTTDVESVVYGIVYVGISVTCLKPFLWLSDVIWRYTYDSTLAQEMACCLTAQSHHLSLCGLVLGEVLLHSTEGNSTENAQYVCSWYEFETYEFRIGAPSPSGSELKPFRPCKSGDATDIST